MAMPSRVVIPVLLLLTAGPALAQEAPKPPDRPKSRVLLKGEVDGLVRALRHSARPDGRLGDGSCLQTAMVLTAAGHCHRYYHAGDGPWIRKALSSLIVGRRGDGSFADAPAGADAAVTTRWVVAAIEVMDPQAYRGELEAGRGYLEGIGAPTTDPMEQKIRAAATKAGQSDDVEAALKSQAQSAMKDMPPPGHGAPDPALVARVLVNVVSCQAAARPPAKAEPPSSKPWLPSQHRGFSFLLTQQEDGVFSVAFGGKKYPDVGLTGIGLAALQTKPTALRSDDERALIQRGLAWLLGQQNEDGSFGQTNVNYSTCSAVMALAASDGRQSFTEPLANAQRYILGMQNAEGRDYARSDRDYGSIGYGGDERGDLSNLQFALEALRSSGLEESQEAFAKAVVFLQRTQNLAEYNDFKGRTREDGVWRDVRPGDDGGSAYYPGNSPAGYLDLPDGTRVPRSYGSMTYALLKAYTLCGLQASDPRIQAATTWIQEHWTVTENPGVDPRLGADAAHQGLYYYYMAMAQALDIVGIERIEVKDAPTVSWRDALAKHLETSQRDDGSWLNERNSRWWENQPLVCTVYSMLALDRCSGSTR